MRLALNVEYDGRGFCGWQSQKDVPSVQAAVEEALSKIAGHNVRVVCGGRTDTGVHALMQVVHFDTDAARPWRAWVYGTNAQLPAGVAITDAREVPDTFHARFSATARRYHYHILNHPIRSALWRGRMLWECRALDVGRMQAAAQRLIGEHDFSSFRGQGCQARHAIRHVSHCQLLQSGPLLTLEIEANGFLMHMVRNIIGVLRDIGLGRAAPEWVDELLAVRDRSQGGVTAPPDGLYLACIRYPDEFGINALAGPATELDSLLRTRQQVGACAVR